MEVKITKKQKELYHFQIKVLFSCFFLVILILTSFTNNREITESVSATQCVVDRTFEFTDKINSFTRQNLWFRDMLFIANNFCYDITIVSILYFFYKGQIKQCACFMGFLMSALTKAFVEDHLMTMYQPPGFNWYFPGIYSIMVPFHDINDFYFSGHISIAALLCYCLYGLKRRNPKSKLCRYAFRFWVFGKLPFIWVMMTITRTHFVIDLLSGLVFSGLCILYGEKLAYYPEVKIVGYHQKNR